MTRVISDGQSKHTAATKMLMPHRNVQTKRTLFSIAHISIDTATHFQPDVCHASRHMIDGKEAISQAWHCYAYMCGWTSSSETSSEHFLGTCFPNPNWKAARVPSGVAWSQFSLLSISSSRMTRPKVTNVVASVGGWVTPTDQHRVRANDE